VNLGIAYRESNDLENAEKSLTRRSRSTRATRWR
jgi:hypothetical protein